MIMTYRGTPAESTSGLLSVMWDWPGSYLLIGVFSSISDRKDLAAPSPESKRLSDQSFSSLASERGSDPAGEAKAILGCLTSPAAPRQATGE